MEKRIINGKVLRSTYRDESTGFTYLMVRTRSELKTLSGIMSVYPEGLPFTAQTHKDAKKDILVVDSFEETTAGLTVLEIERFLVGLVKDESRLSAQTIKRLAAMADGMDLFDIIGKVDPQNHLERELINSLLKLPRQQRIFREKLQQLSGGSIDYVLANKYVKAKQNLALFFLREKPVQTCVRELGMDFKQAVTVSENLGTGTDEDMLAGLGITILAKVERSGSTCIGMNELKRKIQEEYYQTTRRQISVYAIEKSLENNNYIASKDDIVAFGTTLHSEEIIKERIQVLLSNRRELFTTKELEDAINKIQIDEGINYAEAQKAAFKLLRCTGLGILTGGPGTGKTTVLKGLLKAYTAKYPLAEICMASPTGRAAQRMTESTGYDAMTIHRLVGIGRSKRGKDKVPGSIVIIDESSMLDSDMCAWLLMAINDDALVILVGDIDQLPSVGPGNVLKDLIESKKVPVSRLATVYRQSGESPIVTNANRINKGETNLVTDETFVIKAVSKDAEILDEMRAAVEAAMRNTTDPVYGVQVLATSYKGEANISAANTVLQDLINPWKPGMKTLKYGQKKEFREGDKVITTANNYESNYFNGDIGVITSINDDAVTVKLNDRTVKVKRTNLREMSLGYCISIHKSQGSEFEHAIIILPKEPSAMLRRDLLYTSVTRAKKRCTLISQMESIEKCARNVTLAKRSTYLSALLAGNCI